MLQRQQQKHCRTVAEAHITVHDSHFERIGTDATYQTSVERSNEVFSAHFSHLTECVRSGFWVNFGLCFGLVFTCFFFSIHCTYAAFALVSSCFLLITDLIHLNAFSAFVSLLEVPNGTIEH